jgi:methylenetetrahydrofolate dehydrogenase (NADP+) / methenyltetrahydrofolate cyclohydrolase
MSIILDGKQLSEEIKSKIQTEIFQYKQKYNQVPTLTTILVGEDPSSKVYVKMKIAACEKLGMNSRLIQLDSKTTTEELIRKIEEENQNAEVNGILLQHPVPHHINERKAFDSITNEKDVDGVNSNTFGKLSMGMECFYPCTPRGIILLLEKYKISIAGMHAVVIGRSPILGKPMAMMLLEKDATVTICHSKTKNLANIVRSADLIVGAVGKPEFVKVDWIKDNAILIDAGYNAGNVGDIDLKNSISKSSYHTPVPGGVGPMTIAVLLLQTFESFKKKYKGQI